MPSYEKAGFAREGVRREAFAFDRQRIDEVLMARLASPAPETSA